MRSALIGVVTARELADLTPDDQPLIPAFARLGLRAAPVAWDDVSSWSRCQGFLIRSVWDYHTRAEEFAGWLHDLESRKLPVFNSVALIRWNMHKRYLLDLASRGVDIPDTLCLARGIPVDVDAVIDSRGWTDAVIKPAISASGRLTFRCSEMSRDACHALIAEHDVILQELLPGISSDGEWSAVFIDGTYSHGFLKRPCSGEFRVQEEFGGSIEPAKLPEHVIASSEQVVAALPVSSTYARIDGVATRRGFLLLEAECIEPELQLGMCPASYDQLASAVCQTARVNPDWNYAADTSERRNRPGGTPIVRLKSRFR